MLLVALAELATGVGVDEEAPLLGKDLGLAIYETRLLLAGERPKVLLRTADEARARALLAKLRERRHGAFLCDSSEILPTQSMVKLGSFRLGDNALLSEGGDELPYVDLLAIIRAIRAEHSTTTKIIKGRKLSIGAAIVTGGLVSTKKTEREETKHVEVREQLVYLVRKSGAPTWVVRGQSTSFEGLGAQMAPSQAENFLRVIAELRRRSPDVVYDERLLRFHASSDASDERLDEQVHLLSLAIARAGKGPYR